MRIRLVVVAIASVWIVGPGQAAAEIVLSVVSTAPARAHFVAPGAATTFVVLARNTADVSVSVAARIESPSAASGAWQARLSEADALFLPAGVARETVAVTIPARDGVRLLARVAAGPELPEGATGNAVVTAAVDGITQARLDLRSEIRNRPKIYYVAIDGLGRGYLSLNRRGARFDGAGDPLMPRAREFAGTSAWLAGASSVLPAVTDVNHSAALTGSWAGTLGIFAVRQHYMGETAEGREVMADNNRQMLRWGLEGRRVQAVFDVNKDPASGGSPAAFHAIVSGKDWLAELFHDEALDLAVHGKSYPDYVPPPEPYRLGDPPSDDDEAVDREGTNVGPWGIRHLLSTEARLIGLAPWFFPEDRWIAEAAVRIIQSEDPDVLYVDLASTDEAQHVFGAADRPAEWTDGGTPAILWDDENLYNRNANRDPVLDVVHEADRDFGLIADAIEARAARGRSFLVLLSDHGLNTAMETPDQLLDPGRILLDGGFTDAEAERTNHRGELAQLNLRDPARSGRAEELLESYRAFDPVAREWVAPFVVINRDEMDGGTDGAGRAFLADGVFGNGKGELYSQWNLEVPGPANTKVRWPDLFIFTRRHFRTKINASLASKGDGAPIIGVHGASASAEVLLVANGPGIRPGLYSGAASLADIAPTLYHLLGVTAPANVDGRVLGEILAP